MLPILIIRDNKTPALTSLNVLQRAFPGTIPFNCKHKIEWIHKNALELSGLPSTVWCWKLLRHVGGGVSDQGTPGETCLKIPSPLLPRAALIAACPGEQKLNNNLLLEKNEASTLFSITGHWNWKVSSTKWLGICPLRIKKHSVFPLSRHRMGN